MYAAPPQNVAGFLTEIKRLETLSNTMVATPVAPTPVAIGANQQNDVLEALVKAMGTLKMMTKMTRRITLNFFHEETVSASSCARIRCRRRTIRSKLYFTQSNLATFQLQRS